MTVDGFYPEVVDCDKTDSFGSPLLGAKCYIKCNEGYHFGDPEHLGKDRVEMSCQEGEYYNMDWSMLFHAWDK